MQLLSEHLSFCSTIENACNLKRERQRECEGERERENELVGDVEKSEGVTMSKGK